MNTIQKNIKHAMIDADIKSERQLGEKAGIKKSAFSLKMKHGGPWKPAERTTLAKILNKTEEELFGESEAS